MIESSSMAVIRNETDNKFIIAHDTLITYEDQRLKIFLDKNPKEIRSVTDPEIPLFEIQFIFKQGGDRPQILTKTEGETLIVEVTKAEDVPSLPAGIPEPMKIGTLDNKNLYLNLSFSKINKSYWLTYVIYQDKN